MDHSDDWRQDLGPAGSPRYGWRSRGYVPHFDVAFVTQHVVFRLDDALPSKVLAQLESARPKDRLKAAEAALDASMGSRALDDTRVADILQRSLLHFDQVRYDLIAWCVMPTHVHVLVSPLHPWTLSKIVHAWKSFTANRANGLLQRTGRFWAPEYFDHMMRDVGEVALARDYIENNPVVAGLCSAPANWRWSSAVARDSSPLDL